MHRNRTTQRRGAAAAMIVGLLASSGCTQRTAPAVSFASPADLGGFDAVITARGVT